MKNHFIIRFLVVLMVILAGWGFYESTEGEKSRNSVENMRQRAFHDLIDSSEKLSVISSKALVATDDTTKIKLFSQLNTEAYVAQENLSQLPLYHNTLLRTEKFLNQMGDFAFSLLNKTAEKNSLTEKEEVDLASLNKEIEGISLSLHQLAQEEEDPFSWKASTAAKRKLAKSANEEAGIANTSLTKVSSDLEEIPALIYDGPFSDDLENKEPISLEGKEITWDEIIANAKGIFGNEYQYKAYGKSSKNAGLAVYTIEISKGDEVIGYFDYSKIGGYPVQYTAEGQESKEQFTVNQGLTTAENFLKRTAYQNMKSSYYLIDNNVLTVNFIYEEEGVIVYPDMIKISVDLSTNAVSGFEAKNYLEYHKERDLTKKLSVEEAKEYLKKDTTILSEQLAVIPLKNGKEALCYEFKTQNNDNEFFHYINANTGKEEDILRILTTDRGTFTL